MGWRLRVTFGERFLQIDSVTFSIDRLFQVRHNRKSRQWLIQRFGRHYPKTWCCMIQFDLHIFFNGVQHRLPTSYELIPSTLFFGVMD